MTAHSESQETEPVIDIRHVSYRRDNQTLLKDINWLVRLREHSAILGLNGSGKTTLLNMINGYIWPTEGTIRVLGETYGETDLREMRKSIGWVSSSFQEKLYGTDKSQHVVISGKFATIRLFDHVETADLERADEYMRQLGCLHLWDRAYQTCSQGEKQKLLIARALMASPRLLILDEPCNGLDVFSREQLLSSIGEWAGRDDTPTVLLVTHHTEEILPLFRSTLLIRRGEVFASGATSELLTSDRLSRFFESPVEVERRSDRAWLTLHSV
ncbi:ABC transporter ATP-binding protein [Paenibacillus filicis]|uniref:ABC transporter ATP-binding protein n=1 Tax=Paenibacillus gyeongsangnamensis TaxID=3388067 RepID=A0ABT4Q930_9BACL|nr:ABC transporter ATP-binding protein [Paenibacillus filicis]MCZ8513365.1 ABC transporter ATP-binding protein [Paenibacillus filicis]